VGIVPGAARIRVEGTSVAIDRLAGLVLALVDAASGWVVPKRSAAGGTDEREGGEENQGSRKVLHRSVSWMLPGRRSIPPS
jgi:hypothetical protein